MFYIHLYSIIRDTVRDRFLSTIYLLHKIKQDIYVIHQYNHYNTVNYVSWITLSHRYNQA